MSVRHASRSLVDALAISRPSGYVCRQCRRDLQPRRIVSQQHRYASSQSRHDQSKLSTDAVTAPQQTENTAGESVSSVAEEIKEARRKGKALREELARTTGEVEAQDEEIRVAQARSGKNVADGSHDVVKGKDYGKATLEAPENDPHYKPARTWHGLQTIGHRGDWREMPEKSKDHYEAWIGTAKSSGWSRVQLESLLHQAIVECYAAITLSMKPLRLTGLPPSGFNLQYENCRVRVSSEGFVSGVDNADVDAATVTAKLRGDALQTKRSFGQEVPRLLYEPPQDQRLLDARLDTSESMTVAILKRFSELINATIPDPVISVLASKNSSRNNIGAFLSALEKAIAPKPANVAERLTNDQTLAGISNLMVLSRRETPVDKEKEVGRWKIIEAELKQRGLPVLGKPEIQR